MTNIQSGGQISLFDLIDGMSQTAEGEWISEDDIKNNVKTAIKAVDREIRITKFMSAFVNENGLICDFKTVQKILVELEMEGIIDIIRYPQITKNGKKSAFWEEKDGKTVTIRRLGT
jgi:hypothetical protein